MSNHGRVRALVLRTAGTNCDQETLLALSLAGAAPSLLHLNALAREPQRLDEVELLVFPGGFSYGDYVAAGRLYAYELRARLAPALGAYVARGGLALGICNGFQILVETGLFEQGIAAPRAARRIALDANASGRFECRWVELQSQRSACAWLEPGERWPAPVAHAEGRFSVRDAQTLAELRARGQIALTYAASEPGRAPDYPANPNGSVEAIAGICDPTGRVLGLMPHPERNLHVHNHPRWTRAEQRAGRHEGEGLTFFRRLVQCAAAPLQPVTP
jgi:phosphoribosylformylglycinamidine synthase